MDRLYARLIIIIRRLKLFYKATSFSEICLKLLGFFISDPVAFDQRRQAVVPAFQFTA